MISNWDLYKEEIYQANQTTYVLSFIVAGLVYWFCWDTSVLVLLATLLVFVGLGSLYVCLKEDGYIR